MRRFVGGALIAACAVLAPAATVGAVGDPIVATDLLRVRSVSTIDLSRDGSLAVLAVRSIGSDDDGSGGEPRWTNRSHLFLLDLLDDDAEPRQLTFGDRRDMSPVISPDGRRIAFVRGHNGAGQVWVIAVDGGEAQAVSDLAGGAGDPQWSPDGRSILVTTHVAQARIAGEPHWTSERPGRAFGDVPGDVAPDPAGSRDQIRAWLAENAQRDEPFVIDRIDFQTDHALRTAATQTQLVLIDPTGNAPPRQITDGFVDHRSAVFAPTGDRVYTITKVQDGRHPDRVLATEVRAVSENGGADEPVLTLDGWTIREIRPSRDGSVLAFTASETDQPAHRLSRLGIVSIDGPNDEEPVWLTEDHSVRRLAWMGTQEALVFTAAWEGGVPLMTMSLGLLEPAGLIDERDGMPVNVGAFDAAGGVIAYVESTIENPCVVRVRDARGDRVAFDANEWVRDKTLATATADWITRPDGTRVQYWVMEPTHRAQEETYPLAVQIHGGPAGMWGPGTASMWHEMQLLCSWGYGVLYANPRGSGGYGYEFQRANWQNWGEGPGGDVLAAVDQACLLPWVDSERLVVAGGSYGGYLTVWIVGHDHRFKAAVAQRGVYDFATFFGEGNAWRLVEWSMGGPPWDARTRPILQRESAVTFVSRIRTPLLVMHANNDLRTGVSQSAMLYRGLKWLDRPVEYVRYPRADHDLSRSGDPRQRLDRVARIVEFFDRFVENERPAPRVVPVVPSDEPEPTTQPETE